MRASNRCVFLSFSLSFSPSLCLVLSISSMYMHAFYSLVHRSDGYLTGKRKRISLTFLSIRLSTCRCGGDGVGNHLRSSSLFYSFSLSCRSKVVVVVVVMHFFLRIGLRYVLFLLFLSLSTSRARARIYSLFLTEKNTKRYHHCIIAIRAATR